MCSEQSTFGDVLASDGKKKEDKCEPSSTFREFLGPEVPAKLLQKENYKVKKQGKYPGVMENIQMLIDSKIISTKAAKRSNSKRIPKDQITAAGDGKEKEIVSDKCVSNSTFWDFLGPEVPAKLSQKENYKAKKQGKYPEVMKNIQILIDSKIISSKAAKCSNSKRILKDQTTVDPSFILKQDVLDEEEDEYWDFLKSNVNMSGRPEDVNSRTRNILLSRRVPMDHSHCSYSDGPDFSDMCSEKFWDFIETDGKKKEDALDKCEMNSTFWDFLNDSGKNEIDSDKCELNSTFWDFLEPEVSSNLPQTENFKEKRLEKCPEIKKNIQMLLYNNTGSSKAVGCRNSTSIPKDQTTADISFICNQNSLDEEEDFWDFLKLNVPMSGYSEAVNNRYNRSLVELEEMRNLSALSTISADDSSISYFTDSNVPIQSVHSIDKTLKTENQKKYSANYKCNNLDFLLSEISFAAGEAEAHRPSSVNCEQNVTQNLESNNISFKRENLLNKSTMAVENHEPVPLFEYENMGNTQLRTKNQNLCHVAVSSNRETKFRTHDPPQTASESLPMQSPITCSLSCIRNLSLDSNTEVSIALASSNDLMTSGEKGMKIYPYARNYNANSDVFSDHKDEFNVLDANLIFNKTSSSYDSKSSLTDFKENNFVNTESKSVERDYNARINLPIISSCFSLSSCPDFFNEKGVSTERQDIFECSSDVKSSTKSVSMESNSNFSTKENPLVFASHTSFEGNLDCSVVKDRNSHTPQDNRNYRRSVKRLLPKSSPKNSIFHISDSAPVVNLQPTDSLIQICAVDTKRQKTNDVRNDCNIIHMDMLNLPQRIPTKSVEMPVVSGSNMALSNSTPFCFIMPQTTEAGRTSNAEIVMLIGNSMNTNNPNFKVVKTATTCSAPILQHVTCTPSAVNALISNTKQPHSTSGVQKLSNLAMNNPSELNTQVPNTSNYAQTAFLYTPIYQQTTNNVINSKLLTNTLMSKTNCLPNSLSQSQIITNCATVCSSSISSIANNTFLPHVKLSNVAVSKSFQPNSEVNQERIFEMLPNNILPYSKASQDKAYKPTNQRARNRKQEKGKPIKNIAIGKHKNAIQQTSIPLKIDSITNCKNTCNLGIHINCDESHILPDLGLSFTAANKIEQTRENFPLTKQQEMNGKSTKLFNFVSYKPKADSVLVKRDLITNKSELMNKEQFFRPQSNSQVHISNSLNVNKVPEPLKNNSSVDKVEVNVSNYGQEKWEVQLNADVLLEDKCIKSRNDTCSEAPKVIDVNEKPPAVSSTCVGSHKSALNTLQELFPPPISMIPVCVMQPANKSTTSKVLVLQGTNATFPIMTQTHSKCARKTSEKKAAIKIKKVGRKTVRELLQEKYQHAAADKAYQPRAETKILEHTFKVPASVLVPPVYHITDKISDNTQVVNVSIAANSSKRPNIMVLPSATKIIKENDTAKNSNEKGREELSADVLKTPDNISDITKDIFTHPSPEEKQTSKDFRPRYYDMCELTIGYFKVEDDVDSYGKFRSKFKVIYTKRQFTYDFPVAKCNQVDINNCDIWGQMVRVLVPFETVSALNMLNRRINIEVNCYPQIYLWKNQGKSSSSLLPKAKGHEVTEVDSPWTDAMRSSFLHKVTLRKRQADNLRTHLCQFSAKFHLLCTVGGNVGTSITDASPFEEEIASANMKKLYQKNKRNNIRRLPQWDSEVLLESPLSRDDHLLTSNHVCSCRTSCRSLRCSCVKAAKGCSTGGINCMCTNCDNPLNILESFGLNLDFSLSDCCLFQNIYQIPKLETFLQRDVKLSCCNTVARVLDCIPGNILCPNTECNACLEFSWCRGIISYPERNPRNHCSFCGLCCFSNGRHCPVCNRCFVVSSKTPECPNGCGNSMSMKSFGQDLDFKDDFISSYPPVEVLSKPAPKPEIVILDSSFNTKLACDAMKVDANAVKEIIFYEHSSGKDEKDSVKNEIITPKLDVPLEETKIDTTEIPALKVEDDIKQEGNPLIKDEKEMTVDICKIQTTLPKTEV